MCCSFETKVSSSLSACTSALKPRWALLLQYVLQLWKQHVFFVFISMCCSFETNMCSLSSSACTSALKHRWALLLHQCVRQMGVNHQLAYLLEISVSCISACTAEVSLVFLVISTYCSFETKVSSKLQIFRQQSSMCPVSGAKSWHILLHKAEYWKLMWVGWYSHSHFFPTVSHHLLHHPDFPLADFCGQTN